MSPLPMVDFLDHIRALQNKVSGANKRKNKDKPAD